MASSSTTSTTKQFSETPTRGNYGSIENCPSHIEDDSTTPLVESTSSREHKEGGLIGWLIVLGSFICIAVLDGVGYTTGILLNSLMADLGSGRAEVSFSGSLQVGVYSISGPIVGRLVTEWGTRPVCILGACVASLGMLIASFGHSLGAVLVGYSVISGVGFGLMYLPSVVGAAPFFHKRRSLAIGICLCGSGVGTFVLAPFSEAILTRFGWRWVMRSFSILCLGCIFCGMCMVPKSAENQDEEDDQPKIQKETSEPEKLRGNYRVMDPSLFSNPNFPTFLIVLLADFSAFFGIYIPYTHLPPLALAKNISAEEAAFLISAGGISNTIGRFLGGWLCDLPSLHPFVVAFSSVLVAALPSLIIPRMGYYWQFLILFAIFGLSTGCLVGASSPLLLRLLGLKALSQTFGLLTAMRGFAALSGPPVAGALVDYMNNPGVALDLCGVFLLFSTSFYLIAILRNVYVYKRRNYIEL